MSGSAVAASLITGKQIKDHTITKKDISASTVRSLKGQRGQRGATGPRGAVGPQGAQGPAGPVNIGATTAVQGPSVPICSFGSGSCAVATSTAVCPAGMKVVTGASDVFTGGIAGIANQASNDRSAWFVVAANSSSYAGGHVQAVAYCIESGKAVASNVELRRARAEAEAAKVAARMRDSLKSATT